MAAQVHLLVVFLHKHQLSFMVSYFPQFTGKQYFIVAKRVRLEGQFKGFLTVAPLNADGGLGRDVFKRWVCRGN